MTFQTRHNNSPKRLVVLAIALLVCAGTAATFAVPNSDPSEGAALKDVVRRGALSETVAAVGTLEPSQLVQVGAQVTGQLKSISVRLGDRVRAGERIAEIDSLQQQNELRLARASLSQAQATMRARQFQLEKAERTFKRQQDLYAGRAGSGADLNDAESAAQIALAERDLAAAQIENATVEVEKAETNLGYTRILAPIDGRVIALVAKPGQTLNSAQTAPVIAVIAQTDVMIVRAQISEADVGRIKAGQKVQFTTFSDRRLNRESILEEVEPAASTMLSSLASNGVQAGAGASAQAIYFNVLFRASNRDGKLQPMMTADVTVVTNAVADALLVPWAALRGPDEKGLFSALVRQNNGQADERRVRTGITNGIDVQVLEGLAEGEEVLLQLDAGPTDTDMIRQ
ncbi:efflux RND transporter periplasmic adaptor subunit [Ensifer sp. ENS06]|uniref:efflux RND transporter periplasmic adaptor subunit n=1 Tax=Ensifer sp. ENS06 TaxID=2769276 RepID=UPI00177F260D|nr:efflux RND transporter periplasmic adaptor subunit [Ensifer sp. ENS06]MBD9627041.1 efflux RND transporter periplasmic adaptor subunit [Ensifer sp. ENS06]